MQVKNTYVGRFAPSPTGPLHFGSLIAALASYLDAKHHNGAWLLRIEDLDPPRESPSAPAEIIEQLTRFGFKWDGDPIYQSQRLNDYSKALDQLEQNNHIYRCTCSRKSFDRVYPGTCRTVQQSQSPYAYRLRVCDTDLTFHDLFQGTQTFDLENDIGDFILKRKDGLFAYQLAVVVDDHMQGITHIIRGSDLLDSTPRQIFLAQSLGYESPVFGHIPVVVDESGHKLSKQNHADPIPSDSPTETLQHALKLLGQRHASGNSSAEVLDAAISNWTRDSVPALDQVMLPLR